jgi:dTDP-4-dehydrorhamnose reductase
MNILVTGGQGQLGIELSALDWPAGTEIACPSRDELDISGAQSVRAYFRQHRVDAVINTAACTAVDKAESEIGAAFSINALGPALLAEATKAAAIPLVHISTDYVFDGSKPGFYDESDPVCPIGVYGASKEAGEQAVRTGNPRSVILRTAWVVSAHRQNFVKTMLRLAADHPILRVVDDQRGCPTSAKDLARAVQAMTLRLAADTGAPAGTYHFVNRGDTTWCGLARQIFAVSGRAGGPVAAVEAITTGQYPTPARRPPNSRLSTAKLEHDYGIVPRPWQEAVAEIVARLVARPDEEQDRG